MKAFNSELKVEGGKVFCGDEFLFEVSEPQAKAIAHAVNRYDIHMQTIRSLSDTVSSINSGFSKPNDDSGIQSITFNYVDGGIVPVVAPKRIGNNTGTIKAMSDDGYIVLVSTYLMKEDVNAGDPEAKRAYRQYLKTSVKCVNPDENFYQTGAYSRDFKVIEVAA